MITSQYHYTSTLIITIVSPINGGFNGTITYNLPSLVLTSTSGGTPGVSHSSSAKRNRSAEEEAISCGEDPNESQRLVIDMGLYQL